MRVIKTYVADDGTRFDNEYDCAAHEEKMRANVFADSALLFDEDGKRLPLTCDNFGEATFIICKTTASAEYMLEEFGRTWENPWMKDCSGPKAGAWIYFHQEWIEADELLGAFNLIKKLMEENE